ncbi:MAG: hypothetical protein RSH52_11630 [Janthinobacterium sp.]
MQDAARKEVFQYVFIGEMAVVDRPRNGWNDIVAEGLCCPLGAQQIAEKMEILPNSNVKKQQKKNI